MAVVTMRQLLESGVHFGHRTQRWNPKMKRYIFTERNGIYIIDLQQSLPYIDSAYEFVKETVAHGGTVMFVGTKKQAQSAISEQATRVGMPYVNQRWLGGMLTNFSTVHKRLQRLKELDEVDFEDVAGSGMTKKELLGLEREHTKLDRTLGGIRDMTRTPGAIWVVDTNKEHIAVAEARKLNIPVISILDTNCDPDLVDYKIPGNDDAIRSINLLTRVIADAVAEGLMARAGARGEGAPGEELAGDEPLADWERELYLQADVTRCRAARDPAVSRRGRRRGAGGAGGPRRPPPRPPPAEDTAARRRIRSRRPRPTRGRCSCYRPLSRVAAADAGAGSRCCRAGSRRLAADERPSRRRQRRAEPDAAATGRQQPLPTTRSRGHCQSRRRAADERPPRPRPTRPRPPEGCARRRAGRRPAAVAYLPTAPSRAATHLTTTTQRDDRRDRNRDGELHRRGREAASRAHGRRDDGLQERAGRGRRRLRQGRRDPPGQGQHGVTKREGRPDLQRRDRREDGRHRTPACSSSSPARPTSWRRATGSCRSPTRS